MYFYNKKLLNAIDEYLSLRITKKQKLVDSTEYRGLDSKNWKVPGATTTRILT